MNSLYSLTTAISIPLRNHLRRPLSMAKTQAPFLNRLATQIAPLKSPSFFRMLAKENIRAYRCEHTTRSTQSYDYCVTEIAFFFWLVRGRYSDLTANLRIINLNLCLKAFK